MSQSYEIKDLAALKSFAAKFASSLGLSLGSRQIVLLEGPMGAGKTQFTRFLVEHLGSSEAVSPSFAIHNRYDTPMRGAVDHVDLYRLESEDELESTGFWDLFAAQEGLILIEWPERLPADCIPRSWKTITLKFEITGSTSRRITMS